MYKLILATRYLIKRRITYLAVLAVTLCVFVVVVVMTVMTGLAEDVKSKYHSWLGDCIIGSESLVGFPYYEQFVEILESQDFVEAVSPVVKSYGIFTTEGFNQSHSAEILGIDPARYCKVTNFNNTIYYHKNDCENVFRPTYDPNLTGCVVGIDLIIWRDEKGQYFRELDILKKPYIISCFPLTAKGAFARAGVGMVNTKTFYYSDNSHSGLAKVDGSFLYLPLEDAQSLCGMDGTDKRVTAIHVKFADGTKEQRACDKVAALWGKFVEEKRGSPHADLLDKVTVEGWKRHSRYIIAAVETEQMIMAVVFGMLGITGVFIVFVVFYMIVSHKSKDIGILKSIGAGRIDITSLFLGFAFMVGAFGAAIGTIFAFLFLAKINQIENWLYENYGFQLWNRALYAIEDIPNKMELHTVSIIIISAIAACLLGAFIPSRQAAKLKPVETLQVTQL